MDTSGNTIQAHHNNAMNPAAPQSPPQQPRIYPPLLHPLAPTIYRWVPLSASDIQQLRTHNIYNPSLLSKDKLVWHWGNHPVQWVRVVGVVVGIDEFGFGELSGNGNNGGNSGGRKVLTLDDSSGATVECCAFVPSALKNFEAGGGEEGKGVGRRHLEHLEAISKNHSSKQHQKGEEKGKEQPTLQNPAVCWKEINIGTVVKVKGIPSTWRDMVQVNVIKIDVVRTTDEEVKCWGEVARFRKEVLDVPWVVEREEEEKLRRKVARGRRKKVGSRETEEERARRKMSEREKETEKRRRREVETMEKEGGKKGKERDSAGLDAKKKVGYPTLATRRRLAGKYPALGI